MQTKHPSSPKEAEVFSCQPGLLVLKLAINQERTLKVTESQRQIIDAIYSWDRDHGCPPSQTELAQICKMTSTNGVRYHLRRLSDQGLVTKERGKARTVQLTDQGLSEVSPSIRVRTDIPLVGSIAAGLVQEAIENVEGFLPVDPVLFRGTDLFALRVKGDSMIDAGILSGDLAILSREKEVPGGSIAAVVIDGEATLKRLRRKGKSLILQAANPAFEDIVIRPDREDQVRIAGKLVGLIRTEVGS